MMKKKSDTGDGCFKAMLIFLLIMSVLASLKMVSGMDWDEHPVGRQSLTDLSGTYILASESIKKTSDIVNHQEFTSLIIRPDGITQFINFPELRDDLATGQTKIKFKSLEARLVPSYKTYGVSFQISSLDSINAELIGKEPPFTLHFWMFHGPPGGIRFKRVSK